MSGRINIKIMFIEYLKKVNYKKELLKWAKVLYIYREKLIAALFMIIFAIVLAMLTDKKSLNITTSVGMYNGKTFVTETYPIFKDVVFVGDSYAHFLALELGFDTTVYSSPGLTLKELNYCFNSAKDNKKKYVVIFIGPNDYAANTDLDVFNKLLNGYVELFLNNSKVILCSYLPSLYTEDIKSLGHAEYEISEYDNEIKKVANCHDRVYYCDLSEFKGKSEYYKYLTDETDRIHFNHKFYVEYINRLYGFIMSIK